MKTIEYFMIPSSPWTYLGHERLRQIADKHGARIVIKPFDLGRVFPLSGGLPLPKRAPQRQSYRLEELARWRDETGLPLTIHPKFYPTPVADALRMLVAAKISHGDDQAFALAGAFLKAFWADEKDIGDTATLVTLADDIGMEGSELLNQSASVQPDLDRLTEEAIETQVFGSPWYRVDGANFWGQDRLQFVDKALAAKA